MRGGRKSGGPPRVTPALGGDTLSTTGGTPAGLGVSVGEAPQSHRSLHPGLAAPGTLSREMEGIEGTGGTSLPW